MNEALPPLSQWFHPEMMLDVIDMERVGGAPRRESVTLGYGGVLVTGCISLRWRKKLRKHI